MGRKEERKGDKEENTEKGKGQKEIGSLWHHGVDACEVDPSSNL